MEHDVNAPDFGGNLLAAAQWKLKMATKPGEVIEVPPGFCIGNREFLATPRLGVIGTRPRSIEMPVEVMAADGTFDPDAWLVEFNRAVARNYATVPRPPKGWRMVYDYSVVVYWAHGYGPKVVGLERGEDTTSYFREEGDVS